MIKERSVQLGDIVGYVLNEGPFSGKSRPAIVVAVHTTEIIQLQVFTDSDGRFNDQLPNVMWVTSVKYSSNLEAGTWHWLGDFS